MVAKSFPVGETVAGPAVKQRVVRVVVVVFFFVFGHIFVLGPEVDPPILRVSL